MSKIIYIFGTCILLAATAMLLTACPEGAVCASQSQCSGGLYCDLFPPSLDGNPEGAGEVPTCKPQIGLPPDAVNADGADPNDPAFNAFRCQLDVQCEPGLFCDVFVIPPDPTDSDPPPVTGRGFCAPGGTIASNSTIRCYSNRQCASGSCDFSQGVCR